VAETRDAIRSEIFADSSYPQMLLRVGWAPINADPLPSTPRRELDSFVERMTDDEPDTYLNTSSRNDGQARDGEAAAEFI
jgi:hypothetical protein